MLLRHIGFVEQANRFEMALDICGQFEKKIAITGRAGGATAGHADGAIAGDANGDATGADRLSEAVGIKPHRMSAPWPAPAA